MAKEQHLIVVDMQKGFIEGKKPKDVANKTQVIRDLIARCEELQIPITFTMFPEIRYGPLLTEIEPHDYSYVVVKNESDAFSSPKFNNRICDAKTLCLVGCNLDACVKLIAQSAVGHGYEVILYKNALLAQNSSAIRAFKTYLDLFFNPSIIITNYRPVKSGRS